MRVIDHEPAAWYLFQDGADLLLDVNCNASAFGYSVLIRLTPEEAAEYRSAGRGWIDRMATRTQDEGPPGEYQKRDVSSDYGDRTLQAVQAWRKARPDFDWLAGTRWYVTAENLLAYLTDPALRVKTPVADQTLWSIATAADGRFQGTSQTRLWVRTPDGGLQASGGAGNAMDGQISADGEITIVFTPDDPDQAQTVGYGWLRRVDDAWRMEMQMATGTAFIAMHWAYMTQWKAETPPPMPADGRALDGSLRSDEWRWLRGTTWSATDQELFPDGATFTVDSYRNGYFWGDGATAGGSTLRMAASVTPEGTLYLLFSVAEAPAVARRGAFEPAGEAWRMAWSQPSGGPVIGGARQD